METELQFRLTFATIFVMTMLVSGYHRRKARASGGAIARRDEGRLALFLRACMALPLLFAVGLVVFMPGWMEWATFPAPPWARWTAAGIGIGCIPLMWWVFRSIGQNISETVLTKKEHQLVTAGPYRWIRHPLYTVALLEILSLGVLASNWFMLVMGLVGISVFRFVVIPKEEANLIKAFGPAYEAYRQRTGAMLPRVGL